MDSQSSQVVIIIIIIIVIVIIIIIEGRAYLRAILAQWLRSGQRHQKRTKPSWVARAQKPRTAIVRNGLVGAKRPWAKRGLKVQLQRWQLPAWWVALCFAAAATVEKAQMAVGLELFSGKGELTRAFND